MKTQYKRYQEKSQLRMVTEKDLIYYITNDKKYLENCVASNTIKCKMISSTDTTLSKYFIKTETKTNFSFNILNDNYL